MNKKTGWAVSSKKRNWHYFKKNKSLCKKTFVFMENIFEPKINKASDICPQCRKLVDRDKFL